MLPVRGVGGGGALSEIALPGSPVAPPAWSAGGTRLFATADASGIWNVIEIDVPPDAGAGAARQRTRVTGGAFSPAPAPDGRSLYFLAMTAKGVDLRRLDLSSAPPAEIPLAEREGYPLLPRTNPPIVPAPAVAAVSASHSYRLADSPTLRPFVNFSLGPDGNAVQLGLDGDDVLGRIHGLAAASIGDAAGPRGGTVAAAYRGLPVDLVAQLFSAIEKPGRQSLVERPAFDEERLGGYLGAVWSRVLPSGRVRLEAGGGGTDVHAFSEGRHFGRVLGSFAGELVWRRTRGRSGLGFAADAAGSLGATDGSPWQQVAGGLRVFGILPWATLSGTARLGDTYGTPSRFDAFAIGGAPATILPPGLDRNRIESPALPADLQVGERFTAYRAELSAGELPLVLYGDWLRAWNDGEPRPRLRARRGRRAAPRAPRTRGVRADPHFAPGPRAHFERGAEGSGDARVCHLHLSALTSSRQSCLDEFWILDFGFWITDGRENLQIADEAAWPLGDGSCFELAAKFSGRNLVQTTRPFGNVRWSQLSRRLPRAVAIGRSCQTCDRRGRSR